MSYLRVEAPPEGWLSKAIKTVPYSREKVFDILSGIVIFFFFLFLYFFFSPNHIISGDAAELTYGIDTLQTIHPPGYPLYQTLGNALKTILPVPVEILSHYLSGFYSALSLLLFYLFLRYCRRSQFSALCSSITLGFISPYWNISVQAEVYSLLILLLVSQLLAWRAVINSDGGFLLLWFLVGVGLIHHPLNGIIGFMLGIDAGRRTKTRFQFQHFLFLIMPLLFYLILLVPGRSFPFNWPQIGDFDALAVHITGGSFYRFFLSNGLMTLPIQFKRIIISHFIAFPFFLLVGVIGGYRHRQRMDRILWTVQFILLFFLLLYGIPDVIDFLLPSYLIGIYFLSYLIHHQSNDRSILRKFLIVIVIVASLYYSVDYYELRYDWSDYEFTETYAHNVDETVNKQGLVLSDWSHYTILRYYQLQENRLKNLQLISPTHQYDRWPPFIKFAQNRGLNLYTTIDTWDPPDDLKLREAGSLFQIQPQNNEIIR